MLVITDNPVLLTAFQKIVASITEHHFSYGYSPKNRNPETLVNLGCAVVDVKKDWHQIASSFDLVLSLHCKQIFPGELVNVVKCLNLHPGLNPYNRGWFPQVFSIINNLPAGATLHEMVLEIDRGPVIAQKTVELLPQDTSLTAYNRIIDAEIELLKAWLPQILSGNYSCRDTEEGNYNGIADFNELCSFDLNETATFKEFINRIRALSHPPYRNAYFLTDSGQKVYLNLELFSENDSKT